MMESEHGTSLKEIGNFTSSADAAPFQESRQRRSDAATKPKPVITGRKPSSGYRQVHAQDNLRGPHSRAAGTLESERARFFGMRHQRSRNGSDGRMC